MGASAEVVAASVARSYKPSMSEKALRLIPDFDLTARNTLALAARSSLGYVLDDADALADLFAEARRRALPLRILGGGSNVVLSGTFEGITALIATKGKMVVTDESDHVLVQAQAGENWNDFVAWTVAQGFGGIENLASIPGTVGAAPVQNIGAYGAEIADVFESLVAFDSETETLVTFTAEDCAFTYRDSVFKHDPGRYVVLSLRLRFPRPWQPNLRFAGLTELADVPGLTPTMVMERVAAIRASKLPDWRVTPNAGSFFQNPIVSADQAAAIVAMAPQAPNFPQPDGRVKLSAGWLIEQSGLKGFRMERAGVSDRHALVVINLGDAAAEDIAALASHIKATVQQRFGVQLHEEPVFC